MRAAANPSPGTVVASPLVFQGAPTTTTVTYTLTNPLTNHFGINYFEVAFGGAGSIETGTCTDSLGLIAAPTNYNTPEFDTALSPALSVGAQDVFTCTFAAVAQSGANTADQYTQTYKTEDTTNSGSVKVGTDTVYIAASDATFGVAPVYVTSPVASQPVGGLIAGSSVAITYQVTSALTPHKGIAGIPMDFKMVHTVGTYNASGLATLTASGMTDSSGKVTATFFPDPTIADDPTAHGAVIRADALGASANLQGTYESAPIAVTIAAKVTTLTVVITPSTELNQAGPFPAPIPAGDISVESTDVYTNPANTLTPIAVTLAAVNVKGTTAGWSTSACYPADSHACPGIPIATSTTATILAGTDAISPTPNYFFDTDYGSTSYISASASGFTSSNSKVITTWSFATGAAADVLYLKPAGAKSVAAGTIVTISFKFNPATLFPQAKVPITFKIIAADSSAKYSGTFSNGWNNMTVNTDSTGFASANFTVSTVAGAFTQIGVIYPYGYPQKTCGFACNSPVATGVITTVAAPATQLVILASYDNTCTVSPCNFKSNVLLTDDAVNGTTIYLDVVSEDVYGNLAVISTLSNTQVELTPTTGLSASTLYIATGNVATSGDGFGPVSWQLPATNGTVSMLTATATLPVGVVTATLNVTTVTGAPVIGVTSPAPYNGVLYSKIGTITFSGTANASLGYALTGPAKVDIVSVSYSVNGGKAHTYVLPTPSPTATWSFALALPNGLSTIQFNATDKLGNVGMTPIMQVLVDPKGPVDGFTTAASSVLSAGTPVQAWAYDVYGDLNFSSVTVTANGTAIPSTDISILPTTNTLGVNVTYGINITLTAGTWKLKMSMSSYSGVAATTKSLLVTVEVSPGSTFTSTGAAQCTSGGFTGDCITFTNNAASSETVNVYFVWYNTQGQIVNIGAQLDVTVASGATASFFSAYGTSGAYTVQAFVRDTSNNALSPQYQATVNVP